MKLFYEDDRGNLVRIEKIQEAGRGDIVIRMTQSHRDKDIEENERMLSEKFGRKVIILDARYGEVMVLPPSEGRP